MHPASQPPAPTHRLLRGYAFDPSLATKLETALVSEMTYKVPWEALQPGPIGEYLEVVDYDPPSGCYYAPVNLNDERVLAQNGLRPSEGNPQFHQQMVYAVAMTTIDRFERALGRKAFWTDRFPGGEGADPLERYVPRLRIYPHALRMASAYYSRKKGAILCGYFPATQDRSSGQFPGGAVFTCLSHDIIAHEVTHALLDGFHEHFMEATNPDVLAFHEAFADIVALFQHFTFPEVLAHQIARTRGDLSGSENLLAQLATQFGHSRGMHGALRDAIGRFDPVAKAWVRH
ncbi:MAG: peptidase S8, partial [Gemmatimonadetes bacterium]|nr:peptidase S8 [Gemmatimonadota bacterium]